VALPAAAPEPATAPAPASANGTGGGQDAALTFQEAVARLQQYWAAQGCAVWVPHNSEARAQPAALAHTRGRDGRLQPATPLSAACALIKRAQRCVSLAHRTAALCGSRPYAARARVWLDMGSSTPVRAHSAQMNTVPAAARRPPGAERRQASLRGRA